MAKWIALALATFVILLLIRGFIFESKSQHHAEKIIPIRNFAVIENHRMHYYKKENGGSAVVFETAFDPAGHLQ